MTSLELLIVPVGQLKAGANMVRRRQTSGGGELPGAKQIVVSVMDHRLAANARPDLGAQEILIGPQLQRRCCGSAMNSPPGAHASAK